MNTQNTLFLRRRASDLCVEYRSIKSVSVTEINGVVIVRVHMKWWAHWARSWMLTRFYDELIPTLSEPVVLEVL